VTESHIANCKLRIYLSAISDTEESAILVGEGRELLAIFVQSVRTASANRQRNRQ